MFTTEAEPIALILMFAVCGYLAKELPRNPQIKGYKTLSRMYWLNTGLYAIALVIEFAKQIYRGF